MSSFVLDKVHIDVLVYAAVLVGDLTDSEGHGVAWHRRHADGTFAGWRSLTPYRMGDQPEISHGDLGLMLWDENRQSVGARYGETPESQSYRFRRPLGLVLTPGEVFKTIDCYAHQSCDHRGWYVSEAESFCRFLRAEWCKLTPGYAETPWEWDHARLERRMREFHHLDLTVEPATSIRQ